MRRHPLKTSNFYLIDNVGVMVLGVDDDHPYIVYTSWLAIVDNEEVNINFVPLHESLIPDVEPRGYGRVNDTLVQRDVDNWKSINLGTKTFFTIPVGEIFKHFLVLFSQSKKDFKSDKNEYIFPSFFPSSKEILHRSRQPRDSSSDTSRLH